MNCSDDGLTSFRHLALPLVFSASMAGCTGAGLDLDAVAVQTLSSRDLTAAACAGELEEDFSCSISEARAFANIAGAVRGNYAPLYQPASMPIRWQSESVQISIVLHDYLRLPSGWSISQRAFGQTVTFTVTDTLCYRDVVESGLAPPCVSIAPTDRTRWPHYSGFSGDVWFSPNAGDRRGDIRVPAYVTGFGRSLGIICAYWLDEGGLAYFAECQVQQYPGPPSIEDRINVATAALTISPCALGCYDHDIDRALLARLGL